MTASSVSEALAKAQTALFQHSITSAGKALDEAFPPVNPNYIPFGERVLVQIRTPKKKTSGGILLTDEARDTEKWNTQVAKVIALGPAAFKSRTDLTEWPEGQWTKPGDFVRVPKYGGDRWEVPYGTGDDKAMFVVFKDLDLTGAVPDPLTVLAFI